MARKLVVLVSNDNEEVSPLQTIAAIKQAGFSNVFLQWYNKDWACSQQQQFDYAKEQGLNVTFIHLGYSQINHIWLDDEIGGSLVAQYKNDFAVCQSLGVNLVIMHLTKTPTAPEPSELGIQRLRTLADYAAKKGITIAFENTRHLQHFTYVLESVKSDNVGVCFDVGHSHVCFKQGFDFDLYHNRILVVHLHDNDGLSDQHLLPFDGTVDWSSTINGLKRANYQGDVVLELCYRGDYLQTDIVDFYKKGYQVGQELLALLED